MNLNTLPNNWYSCRHFLWGAWFHARAVLILLYCESLLYLNVRCLLSLMTSSVYLLDTLVDSSLAWVYGFKWWFVPVLSALIRQMVFKYETARIKYANILLPLLWVVGRGGLRDGEYWYITGQSFLGWGVKQKLGETLEGIVIWWRKYRGLFQFSKFLTRPLIDEFYKLRFLISLLRLLMRGILWDDVFLPKSRADIVLCIEDIRAYSLLHGWVIARLGLSAERVVLVWTTCGEHSIHSKLSDWAIRCAHFRLLMLGCNSEVKIRALIII
jgi:hypothetical protein